MKTIKIYRAVHFITDFFRTEQKVVCDPAKGMLFFGDNYYLKLKPNY